MEQILYFDHKSAVINQLTNTLAKGAMYDAIRDENPQIPLPLLLRKRK